MNTFHRPLSIPKKLAMINDVAGYGRCSTTEALPIISAMGVQVCLIPTSLFSNHTGFPLHFMHDCTPYLPDYLNAWEKLELSFDGVYCGFLGSAAQVGIVQEFRSRHPEALFILDPVMGDHGRAYRTVTPEHCGKMKELLAGADIVTPNITEACLLTGIPYKETLWSTEELHQLAGRLHAMGPARIVITGLRDGQDYLNFISCQENAATYGGSPGCGSKEEAVPDGRGTDGCADREASPGSAAGDFSCGLLRTHSAGHSWHGTGDIFASIIAADALNQVPFSQSVEKAASFIRTCISASIQLGIPETDGVCFENFLGMLVRG